MRFTARALGIALFATTLLAACSGDDGGAGPDTTDLSGNYTLVSYQVGGNTLTPPVATGTLVLTATQYTISMVIAGQAVNDNGTYTTNGNQITQNSNVQPLQTVGTWSQNGNLFTIDVTVPVQGRVVSVWRKL
jgi:hypothetical protein